MTKEGNIAGKEGGIKPAQNTQVLVLKREPVGVVLLCESIILHPAKSKIFALILINMEAFVSHTTRLNKRNPTGLSGAANINYAGFILVL